MTNPSPGISGWDWITLANESGDIHVPAAGKAWSVPAEVRVRGNRLLYHFFGRPPRMPATINPGSTLLAEFLSLVDSPDDKFASFARRRGVLGLCRHGLPYPHQAMTGHQRWNRVVNCFPGRLRRGSTVGGRTATGYGNRLRHGDAIRGLPAPRSTSWPSYAKDVPADVKTG